MNSLANISCFSVTNRLKMLIIDDTNVEIWVFFNK